MLVSIPARRGGISWWTPIHVNPLNIHFDYQTFAMYSGYLNETDTLSSLLGILNRTLGDISDIVGKISDNLTVIATSLSAYDIAEKIYYQSIQSD